MAAVGRLEPLEWLLLAAALFIAAIFGMVAGVDPPFAVTAAVAAAFLILTLVDLKIGLVLFVAVSFLEMTSVMQHVGLAKLAGAAVAISWLAQVATNPRRRHFVWTEFPGLIAVLSAFLVWALLSTAWADSSSESTSTVYRYLLNAALFPIVYTAVRRVSDLATVVTTFLLGASLSALYGIVAQPSAAGDIARVSGTLGDPNVLAATLVAGFMLSIGLAAVKKDPMQRLVIRCAGGICLLGVLLTVSRGGFLALAAALLFAPWVVRNRPRLFVSIALVTSLCVGYFALLAPPEATQRLTESDGGTGRTDIWKVGWRMVEDRPLTGVGTGNFQSSSVNYVIQPGAFLEKGDLVIDPHLAHNTYLEVLAELGIVGLALFLAFIAACVGAAIAATKRFRAAGDGGPAALAAGVALALVALLAADFFLSEQYNKQLWLLLSLCPVLLSLANQRLFEANASA